MWNLLEKLAIKIDQFLCPHIGKSAYGKFKPGTKPPVQIAIGCRSCGKILDDRYDCDDSGDSIIYKTK